MPKIFPANKTLHTVHIKPQEVKCMNKNNKKTMNERTHNPLDIYKDNKNSNRNNNSPHEEFATEFDAKARNKNEQSNRTK